MQSKNCKNPEKEEEFSSTNEDEGEEMDNDNVIVDTTSREEVELAEVDDSSSDMDSDDSSSDDEKEDKFNSVPSDDDEIDDEDAVIKALQQAKEKKKLDHPPDLDLSPNSPSCMSFHQSQDLLAVATFDGDLRLYSYSNEGNTLINSVSLGNNGEKICRELSYTTNGDKILLASCGNENNDLYFYDVRDGLRLERRIKKATPAAVSALYAIDENTFATGDDDGHVSLWDMRAKNAYSTLKVSEDSISSMITNHEKRILVCTATDGTLYAIKIRGGRIQTESEVYDSEFNCIGLFKQESKLAVGNGQGSIYVFNWDEFGKHADIYTGIGKKEPINAIIPITERIVLTGGEDGRIRAINFYPQKYLGLVGSVPYSIEKMDVCNDGHLIASIGSDEETIKFWNISYFENMSVSSDEKGKKLKHKAKPPLNDEAKSNLPSSSNQNASDFYKGLI